MNILSGNLASIASINNYSALRTLYVKLERSLNYLLPVQILNHKFKFSRIFNFKSLMQDLNDVFPCALWYCQATACWVDSTLGSLTWQYDKLHIQYVLYRHGSWNFRLGCVTKIQAFHRFRRLRKPRFLMIDWKCNTGHENFFKQIDFFEYKNISCIVCFAKRIA